MRIGIIGTGNMGRAMIAGLVNKHGAGVAIFAHDKDPVALAHLPPDVIALPPAEWPAGNEALDAVIVAVKPQDLGSALAGFLPAAGGPGPLWISIAAGVPIAKLAGHLAAGARICRVMPNAPAMVGEAMSAFSLDEACGDNERGIARFVLDACGKAIEVPEKLMNAVTGLSGSGPAYVYLFIEALIEGGVTAGLPYNVARECAVQTVYGATRMVQELDESTAVLKYRVMSPGGTTARGLLALEENGFKSAVIKAIVSAAARAEELGG